MSCRTGVESHPCVSCRIGVESHRSVSCSNGVEIESAVRFILFWYGRLGGCGDVEYVAPTAVHNTATSHQPPRVKRWAYLRKQAFLRVSRSR